MASGAETDRPTRYCRRCGEAAKGEADRCSACGSFLPANEAALIHGGRRFVDGRSPMDEARRVEIRDRVLADLGGADECSEVLRHLVDDFSFACTLRDLLAAHLASAGPLTRRNQQRAALGAWHKASARVEALARRIGTGRKAARVPTLEEVMRGD